MNGKSKIDQTLESSAPNCDCGKKLNFDPFTRTFYCKICDPEFHKDVIKDMDG